MIGILILLLFVIAGILTGLNVVVPYSFSQYIAVAIVFLTGFFGNSLIAIFLVYIGTKLNLDLYLGAVIVFTGRLLNNFTVIRHEALGKIDENKGRFKLNKNNIKLSKKQKGNKENNNIKNNKE